MNAPPNIDRLSNYSINSYLKPNDLMNNASYYLFCYKCNLLTDRRSMNVTSCSSCPCIACFQWLSNTSFTCQTTFTCKHCYLQDAIMNTQLCHPFLYFCYFICELSYLYFLCVFIVIFNYFHISVSCLLT